MSCAASEADVTGRLCPPHYHFNSLFVPHKSTVVIISPAELRAADIGREFLRKVFGYFPILSLQGTFNQKTNLKVCWTRVRVERDSTGFIMWQW